jgi:hypothetical protein
LWRADKQIKFFCADAIGLNPVSFEVLISAMAKTRCIYIQGCARSGNTLMRELCACSFRDAELVMVSKNNSELALKHIVTPLKVANEKDLAKVYIVSRDAETSMSMDAEMMRSCEGLKVIWMLRNPLDVLTSEHGSHPGQFYVGPKRVIQSLELYKKFKDEPQVLTVRYEELISNPNAVQQEIAAAFKLESTCNFTESYKHFPSFRENVQAMHSIRPIDSNSVDKWKKNPAHRDYLKKILAEHQALIPLARDCGYKTNLDPA